MGSEVKFTLKRFLKGTDGVFSDLIDAQGRKVFMTLEHAYFLDGEYRAKIPPGVYKCVQGTHHLHNAVPFVTYEVCGVSGHSGLLFHVGNFNRESDGCILIGEGFKILSGKRLVVNSKIAFDRFMDLLRCEPDFTLEVVDGTSANVPTQI